MTTALLVFIALELLYLCVRKRMEVMPLPRAVVWYRRKRNRFRNHH